MQNPHSVPPQIRSGEEPQETRWLGSDVGPTAHRGQCAAAVAAPLPAPAEASHAAIPMAVHWGGCSPPPSLLQSMGQKGQEDHQVVPIGGAVHSRLCALSVAAGRCTHQHQWTHCPPPSQTHTDVIRV